MHKIFFLLIVLTVPFFSGCTPERSTDPSVERIESYLSSIEHAGFSGSVLVELNGEKVISAGYGFRDREKQLRNSPRTIFDTGSITKQFTAAGILKLEMEGRLSVSDPLANYFRDVPGDKTAITIHDLLRHQSGLQSNVGGDFDPITTGEFIDEVMNSPLRFEPGTTFGYSNIGYSLLALIIERVSGLSYEEYLYVNLWKPAGMESTGYTRPGFDPDLVAVGYYRDDRVWGKPTEKPWDDTAPYWHLTGNGGILSTTEDLYKWHKALKGDNILSPDAREKLYHPEIRPDEDRNSVYAYGWDVSVTKRNTRLVWHNGSNGILYADFHRYIDEDIAIIMMSNRSHPDFNILNREISMIIFDAEYTPVIPHPDNAANREFTSRILQIIAEDGTAQAMVEYENRNEGVEVLDFRMRDEGFRRLFRTNEPEIALSILRFNAELHPLSAPALRFLAEAYMETGQTESAVEYFQKSLTIDPDNPFANEMLGRLQKQE
jgi:CubicO group peptidase (beta-lactamase class C family)